MDSSSKSEAVFLRTLSWYQEEKVSEIESIATHKST